ncbi:MAG TPA: 3-methyl-2-oxobutanoate hydroxymethyltransferase [Vicinamibacterales bacterium]|jgi:3-methyl-2-oxobutanoate hydroxymethyltransferase
MHSVRDFAKFKADGRRISMVTAYDAWSARLVSRSRVDAVLVGDSAAMVMHGHDTTLSATVALMALHTRAVARAIGDKLLIADLPFLSFRQGIPAAIGAVRSLVAGGAQAVKLEGVDGHEDVVRQIVGSGVPVMGHIGLTPQSINHIGGFRVQGTNDREAAALLRQAHALEDLGCFAIVLECVPADLATRITTELAIPTIGIGAGIGTDGQVLVLHDLWGIGTTDHVPRFVRRYIDGDRLLTDALDRYDADVKEARFPGPEESYR